MTSIPAPYSCSRCGNEESYHGLRWHPTVGMHRWERPTNAQIKARMLARRTAHITTLGEFR
jgi:hypothetical protein